MSVFRGFCGEFWIKIGRNGYGGVTRGYGRDCWKFARRALVFRQFWYRFGFRDEDSGGNVDFGTIFLYLIRRVGNVGVGWVVSRV